MMPEKLVTIATFSKAIDAHLSKTRLESEGIECLIADEYIVTMNWLYSNAVGGVKPQVKESDVERAIEILHREPIGVDSMRDGVEESDGPRCPRCNSPDVYYERFSRRLVFVSWLLLGFPLPFLKRRWKCRECGYRWRETRRAVSNSRTR
jgi:DNA-directed RNA polymerase subunit RPC12/RpoP